MSDNLERSVQEYDNITHTIKIITERSNSFEISCFSRGEKSVPETRHFDKSEIGQAVQWSMANNGKRDVYININRIEEDYQQQHHSRIGEHDIDRRIWLLIDLDAEGGKKTNPPKENIDMAMAIAEQIKEDLETLYLWPKPLIAATGNGYHMLYPISCKADDATDTLIQQVTEYIAESYSMPGIVKIDKLHDRSRIVRLYGTINVKHVGEVKTSHIIAQPSTDRYLTVRDLEGFVSTSVVNKKNVVAQNDFDMNGFLEQHVPNAKKIIRGNRTLWNVPCPNNEDHDKDSKPQIIFFADKGNYGFKCHHDSCKGTTVYDFIKKYDESAVKRLKKSNKLSKAYDTKVINGYREAIQDLILNGIIGAVKHDLFTDKIVVEGFEDHDLDGASREITYILNDTVEECRFTNRDWVKDSLISIAQHYKFDSAVEWANNLEWDGFPRLDTMFIDYLDVHDTPLAREAAKWFMVSVAKRIYKPGDYMDKCLLIIGPQGIGKSKMFKFMCPQYFQEFVSKPDDSKELAAITMGNLILELPEATALERLTEERKKAFITSTDDTFRKLYTTESKSVPRRYGIIITSNNYHMMKDATGNRRYLPIVIPRDNNISESEVAFKLNEIAKHGEQIWAEAIYYAKELLAKNASLAVPEYFDISNEAKRLASRQLTMSRSIVGHPSFSRLVELISGHPEYTNESFFSDTILCKDLIWVDAAYEYEYVASIDYLIHALDLKIRNNRNSKLIQDIMAALGFEIKRLKARSANCPYQTENVAMALFRRPISKEKGLGWIPDEFLDGLE